MGMYLSSLSEYPRLYTLEPECTEFDKILSNELYKIRNGVDIFSEVTYRDAGNHDISTARIDFKGFTNGIYAYIDQLIANLRTEFNATLSEISSKITANYALKKDIEDLSAYIELHYVNVDLSYLEITQAKTFIIPNGAVTFNCNIDSDSNCETVNFENAKVATNEITYEQSITGGDVKCTTSDIVCANLTANININTNYLTANNNINTNNLTARSNIKTNGLTATENPAVLTALAALWS